MRAIIVVVAVSPFKLSYICRHCAAMKFPRQLKHGDAFRWFPWTVEAKREYIQHKDHRRVTASLNLLSCDKPAKDKLELLTILMNEWAHMDAVYEKNEHTTQAPKSPPSDCQYTKGGEAWFFDQEMRVWLLGLVREYYGAREPLWIEDHMES